MTVEGSLDLFKLPEILQIVAQQQKTGILTIQGKNDIVAVSFLDGKVVVADSLNQPGEESLARVLLAQGLVEEGELNRLREEHGAGESLNELLVERGLLRREDLLAALRRQYSELLTQVLGWRAGDFKFYTNDEVSYEPGFRPIPVQELLLHALSEEAPEEEPTVELPAPDAVFQRMPSSRPLKVRPAGMEATSEDEGFVLVTPQQQAVLRYVDGQRAVAAIVQEHGGTDVETRRLLAELAARQLIRPRPPSGARPAPAPAAAETASAPAADLGAEIFRPPPEAAAPRPRYRARMEAAEAERLVSWLGYGVAAVLAGLVVLLALGRPQALLLPFPWQEGQRGVLERQLRGSRYLAIDRAAKTHFLLEGAFPERASTLVDLGLLAREDLRDVDGGALAYRAGEVQYEVAPAGGGEVAGELGATEAVTDNFLLDPEFFSTLADSTRPPLVLLD